ncbi:lytic transglycosylase [Photobacterium aquae]|uniref:Lytic transglycosylase n=2 Tax=Photobacterium aquae TaxID=1195763 RepID=A0A0J1H5V9_9GAMM|nr:lytic transglycosylase [Photobacterium aquae]
MSSLATVNASDGPSEFEKKKLSTLSSFSQTKEQHYDAFEQSKQAYLNAFNQAKQALAKKWDNPALTNQTQWVQYSSDDTVKRTVDFETGAIVIEILDEDMPPKKVESIVREQIKELTEQTTQQAYAKDKVLASNNVQPPESLAKTKVMSGLNVETVLGSQKKESFTQKNGSHVTRVSMAVSQDTVNSRAQAYIPYVRQMATKWDIEPALILAIMHTESHFNPMAQSHIPAYGLMQVVPTSAGKDVTKRYLGKEKLLPPEVLFNPEFNIDIGTSYLNILDKHYLKKVSNDEVRTYLVIASYNGGVGAVAKHFSGKPSLSSLPVAVNELTATKVFSSITEDFPYKETRNYLKKVQDKRRYYSQLLNTQSI